MTQVKCVLQLKWCISIFDTNTLFGIIAEFLETKNLFGFQFESFGIFGLFKITYMFLKSEFIESKSEFLFQFTPLSIPNLRLPIRENDTISMFSYEKPLYNH